MSIERRSSLLHSLLPVRQSVVDGSTCSGYEGANSGSLTASGERAYGCAGSVPALAPMMAAE